MPFAEYLWYSNEFISIYEAQIEAACLNIDIPFLPIHKALLAEPELPDWINSDGIHLNSKGHLWIFKRIIKWSPLLELAGINNE